VEIAGCWPGLEGTTTLRAPSYVSWRGLTFNQVVHSIAVDNSPFRRNGCRSAYRGSLVQLGVQLFNTSQRAGVSAEAMDNRESSCISIVSVQSRLD
jgi:hypothetical protein